MGKTILIIGGARSGKSRFAQELACRMRGKVLFVATATPLDEEMRSRITEHRSQRPAHWRTLEAPSHVGRRVAEAVGDSQVVVLDCLTLLVSNVMFESAAEKDLEEVDISSVEAHLEVELQELKDCIDSLSASFIIVSNEVGMGLVPLNRSGRLFRDFLGRASQLLAERADEVYLVTAGIPHLIKGAEEGRRGRA